MLAEHLIRTGKLIRHHQNHLHHQKMLYALLYLYIKVLPQTFFQARNGQWKIQLNWEQQLMQVMHGRKDKENMSYEKLDGFK